MSSGRANDRDPHVRAAVELLIWRETWLRRKDFTDSAVRTDRHGAARESGA